MENQTTALEDLKAWVEEHRFSDNDLLNNIEELMSVEKQQITDAFQMGAYDGFAEGSGEGEKEYKSSEDYYLKAYPKGL